MTETISLKADSAGTRLDSFLAANIPELTRSAAQRLIEDGRVSVNGRAAAKRVSLSGLCAGTQKVPFSPFSPFRDIRGWGFSDFCAFLIRHAPRQSQPTGEVRAKSKTSLQDAAPSARGKAGRYRSPYRSSRYR